MADRLTATNVTEFLDRMGALDDARRPGCYSLRLQTPQDDAEAIRQRWQTEYVADPPDGLVERLAGCEKFCYVGSHGTSIYTRLCQHADGHKSSTIMTLWPPVGIEAIWPTDEPTLHEWSYANELADDTTAVWTDGSYL